MSYHYYEGAPGTRYCWALDPTFICPISQLKYDTADEQWSVPDEFTAAANLLGVEPSSLLRLMVRGHRNNRRMRIDGKLTDRCETCGHKMERKGFRTWSERDRTEPREGVGGVSDDLTRRFGGTPSEILKTIYFDTKKEARAWALENSQVSQAIQ